MLPDRVSNPGPLTYESDALPIALCGPALIKESTWMDWPAQQGQLKTGPDASQQPYKAM